MVEATGRRSFYFISLKHTKTEVNSTMQFFESRSQKKYLVKVSSFLAHPPQYDGTVKVLRN